MSNHDFKFQSFYVIFCEDLQQLVYCGEGEKRNEEEYLLTCEVYIRRMVLIGICKNYYLEKGAESF